MVLLGVVIPAYNEERRVGLLLDGLRDLEGLAQIAVVCNGCSDRTATVVRTVAPWVDVVEIDAASKPAALRAGDRAVSALPRLYLDADVELTSDGVQRLIAALTAGGIEAVAPTPRYDSDGASAVVKSHYRVWTALQSTSTAISGTGAMMVSAAGRSRFDEWPDVLADDYYLDGLFSAREKRRLPDVEVIVRLPRRFGDCVSRRARVHQGNRDVVRSGLRTPHNAVAGTPTALFSMLHSQPWLIKDLPAHAVVVISTRLVSSWRRRRGTAAHFHRDDTSR